MSGIAARLNTLAEQTDSSFTWTIQQLELLQGDVESGHSDMGQQLADIMSYMTFDTSGLTIGKAGNPFTFRVVNDRLAFFMNNSEVAYLSNNKLYVTQAEILTKLQIGKFAFEPQTNGNLSVIYSG